jgi:hypothetical protein
MNISQSAGLCLAKVLIAVNIEIANIIHISLELVSPWLLRRLPDYSKNCIHLLLHLQEMLCDYPNPKYIEGHLQVSDTLVHGAMYVATAEETQVKFVLWTNTVFLFLTQLNSLKTPTFNFLDNSYSALLQRLSLQNRSLLSLFSCSGELK